MGEAGLPMSEFVPGLLSAFHPTDSALRMASGTICCARHYQSRRAGNAYNQTSTAAYVAAWGVP